MNRGQFRRNIFLEDKGRQSFLELIADIGLDLEEIVEATAQEYGKEVKELKRRRRGGEKNPKSGQACISEMNGKWPYALADTFLCALTCRTWLFLSEPSGMLLPKRGSR